MSSSRGEPIFAPDPLLSVTIESCGEDAGQGVRVVVNTRQQMAMKIDSEADTACWHVIAAAAPDKRSDAPRLG